jgi:hypothetical protein
MAGITRASWEWIVAMISELSIPANNGRDAEVRVPELARITTSDPPSCAISIA